MKPITINAIVKIINGPHMGNKIIHQDQLITLLNLSIIRAITNSP